MNLTMCGPLKGMPMCAHDLVAGLPQSELSERERESAPGEGIIFMT